MTYAAYLRMYEPVSAFHEPDRSRWAAYAASSERPRRRDSLMVEHAEALRRAIAAPQIVVPEQESEHAYVRHADGVTYICPWQTRLRCLLAYGRMLSVAGPPVPGTVPANDDDETMGALAQLEDSGTTARLHTLASAGTMPPRCFVVFWGRSGGWLLARTVTGHPRRRPRRRRGRSSTPLPSPARAGGWHVAWPRSGARRPDSRTPPGSRCARRPS